MARNARTPGRTSPGMSAGRGWSVALLVLVIAACSSQPSKSPGQASSGPGATSPAGPVVTVGPFADPGSAAAAVLGATDDASRRAAILAVLGAVGIGVYAADGTPVVLGAERSESDFWMNDFELDGLVAGMAAGDRVPLAEFAEGLAGLGVATVDGPVTEATLGAAVRAGTAAAVGDPGNRVSLALLIARALGLGAAKPVDLAAASQDSIELDPLSNLLVAADIMLPSQAIDPAHASAASLGLADVRATPREIADADPDALPFAVASGGCGQIAGANTVNSWGAGQAAVQLLAGGIRRGMPVSQMLHAILLNGVVEVRTKWDNPHYHHDDGGGSPTDLSELVATYVLRIRPSQTAVECGLFKAILLGAEGPLVGLPVTWDGAGLARHGSIDCSSSECKKTQDDGSSTLTFDPKTERSPVGIGPEVHVPVRVTAEADVLAGLGADLFSRIPNAPIKKLATFDVDVSYHRAYQVFLYVNSELYIHPIKPPSGPSIFGNDLVGTAYLDGELEVTAIQDGNGLVAAPTTGVLEAHTVPPAGVPGDCWTATADSHGTHNTKWAVLNAVLWPPSDISVSLDVAGQNSVDSYWYVQCPPSGKLETKNDGNVIWENQMFLSHGTGRYGMEFAGLEPELWTYYDNEDTWEKGGVLAKWRTQELCNGNCRADSYLDLTLRIVPLPMP